MTNNVVQLKEAFNAFEDAIYIINSDYTIKYMNKAMIRLFGDGKGMKCYDLVNKGNGICPWCNYEKVITQNETHTGEIFIPTIEKAFYHTEFPFINSDGTKLKISIFRDITLQKEQEAKLKISEEKYRRLFDEKMLVDGKMLENKMKKAHDFLDKIITCSPDAIMAADLKGNIIIWNQGAEEIFGYKAKEVIGKKNIKGVYSKGHALKVMKIMRSGNNGGKLKSYPLTAHRKTGEIVEGSLSASILYDEQGNEIATVGIFVDLGDRLKMERKLSETRQQLLHSEKLAAMGRLTSQIAHELNNPLFGIMNTLELMKTEISPQNRRRKLLDMSLSEIVRLADMLKKMLSFSRPDQEEKSNININIVLEGIILLYEKRLKENSIKLTSSFVENPGLTYASKDQLRQVFLNMISNAMDAMPNGGSLSITTALESDKITVIISDTGVGIKDEFKEKIFDSFFTTKTESAKGVGLGLSVCYGFIKDHGGNIEVKSKYGKGTKFIITLPVSV